MTAAESHQSLRAVLADLEAAGELRRVEGRVAARYELSALLAANGGGPVLRFDDVDGAEEPVIGNLAGTRERIARAIGATVDELQARIEAAIERPLAPREVAAPPCQQVVVEDPDLSALPLPTFFEHETGPYVTAGAIVARDPQTGAGNLSIARLKPLGGARALAGIAPNHHLAALARAAAARGESLPIAVTIGNHPAVLIAACLYLGRGDDELHCAGAVLGEPLQAARTAAGLLVPAHAEIVLEGTLAAERDVPEGAVSEFHGFYEDYGNAQVATFQRMTTRRRPILQVIEPGLHPEHVLLGAVAIAAGLARTLRALVPEVAAVALPSGGCGRLSAVIALSPGARPGSARRLMLAAWAHVTLLRTVTVVDAGIDPWDHEQVEWARTSFARPDADLLIVGAAPGDRADPLESEGAVAKLGIDATSKPTAGRDLRAAAPPAEALQAARRRLAAD